jgi:hypothetical protein
MRDQMPRLAAGTGLAQVSQLEEGRPGDQRAAAQPGQQRDAPLDRDQPGGGPGGEDRAGEVDQLAALPVVVEYSAAGLDLRLRRRHDRHPCLSRWLTGCW